MSVFGQPVANLIIWGGCLMAGLILAVLIGTWLDLRLDGAHTPDSRPRERSRAVPAHERPAEVASPRAMLGLAAVGLVPGTLLLLKGLPIFGVPMLVLTLVLPLMLVQIRRARWTKKLNEQALQLTELLVVKIRGQRNLWRALEEVCSDELPNAGKPQLDPLAREINDFLLLRARTDMGASLGELCYQLARSPRYRDAFYFVRLLQHLSSVEQSSAGSESIIDRLTKVADVMKKARRNDEALVTKLEQAKGTRWLMSAIIPVTALIIMRLQPLFGAHLLHHPAGQIALVFSFLMLCNIHIVAKYIARLRPLRF